jgi:PAS domain S-box-containing protein
VTDQLEALSASELDGTVIVAAVSQIVEASVDAYLMVDAGGRILAWNKSAERIFGYSAGEAIGQTLDIIVPERSRARHWEAFFAAVARGETKYADELLSAPATRKDGSRVSIDLAVTMIRDPAGKGVGVAACIRDVTEKRETERQLRARIAELEAASA